MMNIFKKIISGVAILSFVLGFSFNYHIQPVEGASALVQTASGNGNNGVGEPDADYMNTYPLAFGSNVTAGSLLLACVTSGATDVVTLTDNNSNSWVQVTTVTEERKTELWRVYNANAGATTVTLTFQPGRFADSNMIIREYSGIDTTNALDVFAVGQDYGGFLQTHTSSSTATTAQNDELIIACEGTSGASDPVLVAGTNYGNQRSQNGDDVFTYGGMEDRVVSSTGTYLATFGTTGFVRGETIIATFKITGAPAAPTARPEDIFFFE